MGCKAMLQPFSTQRAFLPTTVCPTSCSYKVCKNRLDCRTELPFFLGHQSIAGNRVGYLNARKSFRGRDPLCLVTLRPISVMNAAVSDDSSIGLPDKGDDLETGKDGQPGQGGLLQWFRKAWARRAAQKEELISSLRRYGVAGVLSYGLLNTVYYLVAFLFVWFYVAPSPGGLGFVPAAQRFAQVFAAVWAGSQVTKLLRAAGALSLAPLVDRGLNWYTHRFNFKSRGQAFGFLVFVCFGLAALVFLVITTLWS